MDSVEKHDKAIVDVVHRQGKDCLIIRIDELLEDLDSGIMRLSILVIG